MGKLREPRGRRAGSLLRSAPFGLGRSGPGTAFCVLSFVALPAVLLWRPLLAGEALFWGTPLLQFVPWQRMAAEIWRAGHLPLWNHLVGCGAPLAANYQTGAFYPLYGLALILPAEVALGWSVFLHLALAGFGMYAWARAAGMDRFPALLAGLALEGSGFLVARAGLFPSIAVTFPWLPVWLWRAECLARSGSLRDALWLGGALGLGLLAGHAQTAFYGLLLLVAYLAFHTLGEAKKRRQASRPGTRVGLRAWSLVICACVVGLSLAAVQLAPTAELLRFSQRATGVDRELGLTYSLWPWRLLTLALPGLFGNPAWGDYWGYGSYWEDAVYVGLLPFLLAVEAVAGLRRRSPWRSPAAFWAIVAGVSLLLAFGRNTPVFPWLFEHVPTFDWFQAPARWLALATVGLAALAGIGAQRWHAGRASRRRGELGVVLGLAAALGGLAAPRLVPDIRPTFGPATVRLGLALVAVGGLALVRRAATRRPGWWQAAVVGVVLLDLVAFGWGLVPSVDRALYAGRTASGAALEDDPAVGRIFWPAEGRPEPGYDLKFGRYFRFDTFGPRKPAFWRSLRETLLPNLAMLDGVASANNFDPLLVGWTADVARAADDNAAILRVMGVTHIVTATADARQRVTPVPSPFGAVWVVPAARRVATAEALASLTDPGFEPAGEVLLETVPVAGRELQPSISSLHSLTLKRAPNRTVVHAIMDTPGYVVLPDTWYPGWRATVDGEPVPLLRANYAFRTVYLEAGEHTMEMVYRPLSVIVGGAVSLVSLAGLTAGLILTRRRETQP